MFLVQQKKTNTSLKRLTSILVLGSIAVTLCSCSSRSPRVKYTYVKSSHPLPQTSNAKAERQLTETAASVTQSLNQLSSLTEATHPNVKLPSYNQYQSSVFKKLANLHWNGPVEPPLKNIAKTIKYKLTVIGSTPAIPAIINIQENNKPISTILRNINYQLISNNSGKIVIYPKKRIIELRYNQ